MMSNNLDIMRRVVSDLTELADMKSRLLAERRWGEGMEKTLDRLISDAQKVDAILCYYGVCWQDRPGRYNDPAGELANLLEASGVKPK